MKALILAGGRGKRLDEFSAATNKCMIKINGKPAIEYSLDCALSCGIKEIIVVVGYRAEDIINVYGVDYRGCRLKYVIQLEQKGLVHAISCAREAIGEDDFMLFLGDEIMVNPRHAAMLDEFKREKLFALCGVLKVENREMIRRTYMVIGGEDRVIHRLVEKPPRPLNDIMGTGDCVFKNAIFDYIEMTPIHHERNEKELPDLIQCAVDDGKKVKYFLVCDRYTNINAPDDIKMAESFFKQQRR
jgi:dTDP-glucose pyrophosphorylase